MTPTDPEVRRAQEWLTKERCISDVSLIDTSRDSGRVRLSELLSDYYAEQRTELISKAKWYMDQGLRASLKAAESQLSTLREGLRWAMRYINDGLEFDEDDKPKHDCAFFTDPEKGGCDFCENYWGAERILSTSEGSPAFHKCDVCGKDMRTCGHVEAGEGA